MLQVYRIEPGRVEPRDTAAIGNDGSENYWLDLRDPTPEDRSTIEWERGLILPAINDVREIEATSRFFADRDGVHLRIWFLDQSGGKLSRRPAAFVLMDLQQVLAGLEREDAVPATEAGRFAAITRDLESLLAHSNFISGKLDFLIGMVMSRLNLIDNRVGTILSVVALVFLPPALIGSIYGMNFHFMPELALPWAYPLVLLAMLASAVIPYLIFKWRQWL